MSEKSIDSIQNGQGAIIDENGEKFAAYKDKNGKVIKLDPRCTHLKCIVNWDETENVWICPCHGAKYDPSGKVIQGPAKKDLKSIS